MSYVYYDYENLSSPFDDKNAHLEDLPAIVCKFSHIIKSGHWSVHNEPLERVCSPFGGVNDENVRVLVFAFNQFKQGFSFHIHLKNECLRII